MQKRIIDESLSLVPYYPNYEEALKWYQDPQLCKQVDNIDHVYTLDKLKAMYDHMSSHGECYYIEYKGRLVGDITLNDNDEICIVVSREYQNRHIGRKSVKNIIDLAKEKGIRYLKAEIYSFNEQSKKMFSSLGFRHIDNNLYMLNQNRIEASDLYLDKARFCDWSDMYENVWSRPECSRYMRWSLTENENDAQIRIRKTIEFQRDHDTYLVYEKKSGKAIGFAGVEKIFTLACEEAGICLGAEYMGKGYGKQILKALMDYAGKEYGAKEFLYSTREENTASKKLAAFFGFKQVGSENMVDDRDGHTYKILRYRKSLTETDVGDFGINEMKTMQRSLQLKYQGKWETIGPETGKNKLLWMIGEIGEVTDIIKKNGGTKSCEDLNLRKNLIEELADVLMYYNDVLLCYGITAEELKKCYTEKYERNLNRW